MTDNAHPGLAACPSRGGGPGCPHHVHGGPWGPLTPTHTGLTTTSVGAIAKCGCITAAGCFYFHSRPGFKPPRI